jgi:hypothetical protein
MGRGKPLTNKIEGGGEILTHEETLRILPEMARNGSGRVTNGDGQRFVRTYRDARTQRRFSY